MAADEFLEVTRLLLLLTSGLRKTRGSTDIGTVPFTEGLSPRHQVVTESGFDFAKKFEMNLTYRYVSALATRSIPAYSTGDARLAWKVRPDLELALVGRNMFQPWHLEYADDPNIRVGIKRSGYVKLTWTR